jgi:hypothetical protein
MLLRGWCPAAPEWSGAANDQDGSQEETDGETKVSGINR